MNESKYADWYPDTHNSTPSRIRTASVTTGLVLALVAAALLFYTILSLPTEQAPVDTTAPVATPP